MKTFKNLIIFVALLFICLPINAQISLKQEESFSNQVIPLGNISGGEAMNVVAIIAGDYGTRFDTHSLYCQVFGDELIYGIVVDTENRFDDNFHLALGKNAETTIQSINELIEWLDNSPRGKSITFEDTEGRVLLMTHRDNDRLYFSMKDDVSFSTIVGPIDLSKKNLQRAISIMENGAEETVFKKIISDGDMEHPAIQQYLKEENEKEYARIQKENRLTHINNEIAETRKRIKALKKDDKETASTMKEYLDSLIEAKKELESELGIVNDFQRQWR